MHAFPEVYYPTRFLLAREPGPAPFAIITACHPMDQRHSPRMNQRADHRLQRYLKQCGLTHFRASGHAPDHSHEEPGWGVITSLENARKIARHFRQRALWWIENDQLTLVHAHMEIRETLGSFHTKMTIHTPPP